MPSSFHSTKEQDSKKKIKASGTIRKFIQNQRPLLLTKPGIELTKKEEKSVKKVASDLLATLKKEKLVLDWRKRQQSRAAVRLCVEETLDQLPPAFTVELYQQKCELVYQHIYDSYYGQGKSIYAAAA